MIRGRCRGFVLIESTSPAPERNSNGVATAGLPRVTMASRCNGYWGKRDAPRVGPPPAEHLARPWHAGPN